MITPIIIQVYKSKDNKIHHLTFHSPLKCWITLTLLMGAIITYHLLLSNHLVRIIKCSIIIKLLVGNRLVLVKQLEEIEEMFQVVR
jgi:hypothetical protein